MRTRKLERGERVQTLAIASRVKRYVTTTYLYASFLFPGLDFEQLVPNPARPSCIALIDGPTSDSSLPLLLTFRIHRPPHLIDNCITLFPLHLDFSARFQSFRFVSSLSTLHFTFSPFHPSFELVLCVDLVVCLFAFRSRFSFSTFPSSPPISA